MTGKLTTKAALGYESDKIRAYTIEAGRGLRDTTEGVLNHATMQDIL
jgi:hypothetical protein